MRATGLAVCLFLLLPRLAPAQAGVYDKAMHAAATLQLAAQSPLANAQTRIANDLVAPRRFHSRAPGATLMIIGGAGILAGALVGGSGGTALILAGVGVGAYGLYLFTR